jgi:fatty acid desaturase
MNEKEYKKDWLKPMFSQLTKEELPASFRDNIMKRIRAEADRKKKRNELMELAAVCVASLAFIGLAAGAILYTSLPDVAWWTPDFITLPFYLYIGALTLLLLGVDHFFRQMYRKKHPD